MNKSIIIIIALLIAILIVVTLFILPSGTQQKPVDEPVIPEAEPTSELTTGCEGLSESEEAECLKNLAVEKKDMSYCDQISLPGNSKGNCQLAVIMEIGDPSLCEMFESKHQRSPCYEMVAISLKDSSICELITDDEIYRQQCLTQVGTSAGNSVDIYLTEDVTNPPSLVKVEGTVAEYEYYPEANTKVYFSFKSPLDRYYDVIELDNNLNYVDLRLEIPELSNSTHIVSFQKNRISEGGVLDMAGDESDRRLTGAITISPDFLTIQSRADECKEFMTAPAYCYTSEETDIAIKVWINFAIEN